LEFVMRFSAIFNADLHLFERNRDEPFEHVEHGRRHVCLVGHKCHEVTLKVHYEQHTKEHHFRPSATVFKALQWAIGKHGYNLDPMAAAKGNLILPDAESPLPRDDVLGKYVKPGHCTPVANLTLQDFTLIAPLPIGATLVEGARCLGRRSKLSRTKPLPTRSASV
jgi:hypothetical protein